MTRRCHVHWAGSQRHTRRAPPAAMPPWVEERDCEQVLLPAAYAFAPDLVLVSAGFDAAYGDPLGGCMVTPAGYAHLLHALLVLAHGRVVVALEGGYNPMRISECAVACTQVLLGATPPPLPALRAPKKLTFKSILGTLTAHATICKAPWAAVQLALLSEDFDDQHSAWGQQSFPNSFAKKEIDF